MIEYLACPFAHHDKRVMRARLDASIHVMGKLMREGRTIFNPLSHGFEVTQRFATEKAWAERWLTFDMEIIEKCCQQVLVLMIDGWNQSVGVQKEIGLAQRRSIPLVFLKPIDYGLMEVAPYLPWHKSLYHTESATVGNVAPQIDRDIADE